MKTPGQRAPHRPDRESRSPLSVGGTTPVAPTRIEIPLSTARDHRPNQPVGGLDRTYGEVLAPFIELMEAELRANAHKGGRANWLTMPPTTGILEIYYHTAKLQRAVADGDLMRIREHSADVANMAMMLLDVCGGLHPEAAHRDVQSESPQ